MPDFKNSETCLNLMRSFAGESQAHMRYILFAARAKQEGLHEIEEVFKETADNESAHAHIFMKHLHERIGTCSVPVNGEYPVHLGDTKTNLAESALAELDETSNVYPTFAKKAREEGFEDIALSFEMIGQIEQEHEGKFTFYKDELENNTLFSKDKEVYYRCIHCGYIHKGNDAPKICPNCKHPQGFFKVVQNRYK